MKKRKQLPISVFPSKKPYLFFTEPFIPARQIAAAQRTWQSEPCRQQSRAGTCLSSANTQHQTLQEQRLLYLAPQPPTRRGGDGQKSTWSTQAHPSIGAPRGQLVMVCTGAWW